jgi:hypothetical protein
MLLMRHHLTDVFRRAGQAVRGIVQGINAVPISLWKLKYGSGKGCTGGFDIYDTDIAESPVLQYETVGRAVVTGVG